MNHADVLEEIEKDERRKELRREIIERMDELEELGKSPLDSLPDGVKKLVYEDAQRQKKESDKEDMINKIANCYFGGE